MKYDLKAQWYFIRAISAIALISLHLTSLSQADHALDRFHGVSDKIYAEIVSIERRSKYPLGYRSIYGIPTKSIIEVRGPLFIEITIKISPQIDARQFVDAGFSMRPCRVYSEGEYWYAGTIHDIIEKVDGRRVIKFAEMYIPADFKKLSFLRADGLVGAGWPAEVAAQPVCFSLSIKTKDGVYHEGEFSIEAFYNPI